MGKRLFSHISALLTRAGLVFAAATLPVSAFAQDVDTDAIESAQVNWLEIRAEQVIAIINGEAPPDIFTNAFLAAVPPEQLQSIGQQLNDQFGKAIAVESFDPPDGNRARLAIRMERAIARGGIAIDPSDDHKISELLFQSFEPIGDTPAKIEADLAALPGDVSYWFGPLDGASPPILASEWGDQMPVGSTFKLYVLATLARDVAKGQRRWDDVVTLGDTRSFPSGMMQDWPEDAALTLETLASLMISVSDNTATDALMEVLGRDAVYQTMVESGHSEPELNDPFMTTREMFLLKGGPPGRLQTYQRADPDVRRQILDGIEDILLPSSQIEAAFSQGPIALDVEWFASATDLLNLLRFMRETADPKAFEIMAINQNMTDTVRENWLYVGYKGGSEPGVLNLTWLLEGEGRRDYALVLSWANPEANLEQSALELIGQRILALPR